MNKPHTKIHFFPQRFLTKTTNQTKSRSKKSLIIKLNPREKGNIYPTNTKINFSSSRGAWGRPEFFQWRDQSLWSPLSSGVGSHQGWDLKHPREEGFASGLIWIISNGLIEIWSSAREATWSDHRQLLARRGCCRVSIRRMRRERWGGQIIINPTTPLDWWRARGWDFFYICFVRNKCKNPEFLQWFYLEPM